MIGIEIASETPAKCSKMPSGEGTRPTPWYGGIIISIEAPRDCASFARATTTSVEKWLTVTITGTRPATWSRLTLVRVARSASDSRNCSE